MREKRAAQEPGSRDKKQKKPDQPGKEEQDDPKKRIAELEEQVKELLEQIDELTRSMADWHSAMFSALNLVLKQYSDKLEFEREHLLNLMPRRIDYLVLKKDPEVTIELDAFRLFQKHNIVEGKSYEDAQESDLERHQLCDAVPGAAGAAGPNFRKRCNHHDHPQFISAETAPGPGG